MKEQKRTKSAGARLRGALRTKKQKNMMLVTAASLAVLAVCMLIVLLDPTPSEGAAYLLMTLMLFAIVTAVYGAVRVFFEGRALRASMRRIAACGGEEAVAAELETAKTLCGGPIRLSENWLFGLGAGAAVPLASIREAALQAVPGRDQDVFAEMRLTVDGEKKPVAAMREEVGFVNRGVCERSAEFIDSIIKNGGRLPEKTAQSAEKGPKTARASAKEVRALLAELSESGLPEAKQYALYLRRKDAPEAGGLLVARGRDNRMNLTGETELLDDELVETGDGLYELSREKTAALGREKDGLGFVLEETSENGRRKVYRITPEQFLQLDKYLFESGRA